MDSKKRICIILTRNCIAPQTAAGTCAKHTDSSQYLHMKLSRLKVHLLHKSSQSCAVHIIRAFVWSVCESRRLSGNVQNVRKYLICAIDGTSLFILCEMCCGFVDFSFVCVLFDFFDWISYWHDCVL